MAKDVKFNIRLSIDGKEHVVSTTSSVRDLQNAVKGARADADRTTRSLMDWANARAVLDGLGSSLRSLQGVMNDLASAYAVQEEAETKLATVMRERMNASDADIQSIKDLASAQQELGVIGDEVQLAGAQQVSTFLEQKASLETLLPAMNDLLAQQKGLNATSSDAVSIGNLMGKAMQGQTSALKRVGITFNDAQEQVMKYGTEQERASMLAEIITQNVGHMNSELANTGSGQIKQLSNALSDVKEQMGKIAQTAMPYVTMAAQASTAAMGVAKLATAFKGAKAAAILMVSEMRKTSATARIFTAAMSGAAFQTTALKIAIRGLMISTGVGAALAALLFVIEKLTDAGEKASGALDGVTDSAEKAEKATQSADDAYNSTLSSTFADMSRKYTELSAQWKKLSGEHQKVQWIRNNAKELKNLGIEVRNVSDAESIFRGNTDSVVEAFKKRAEAAARMAKLTELYRKQMELTDKRDKALAKAQANQAKNGIKAGDVVTQRGMMNAEYATYNQKDKRWHYTKEGAQTYNEMNPLVSSEVKKAEDGIKEIDAEINKIVSDIKNIPTPTITGSGGGSTSHTTSKVSKPTSEPLTLKNDAKELSDIENNVRYYREQLNHATKDTAEGINHQIAYWQGLADEIRNAGKEMDGQEFTITAPQVVKQSASSLNDIQKNIQILQDQLGEASIDEAAGINREISLWQKKADAIRDAGKAVEEEQQKVVTLNDAWNGIKSVGDSLNNITDALNGNKNAWDSIVTVVDSAIQLYNGISTVIGFIEALSTANKVAATTETAKAAAAVISTAATATESATTEESAVAAVPSIAANKALTASYVELASAEYMAAHASIPIVGYGLAAGFSAAAAATVRAIGAIPFANGGVVSGPTYALVGEYAGAQNNPEVIAPLDKLRSLIDTDNNATGNVRFEIEGRKLVGILSKENNISRRS